MISRKDAKYQEPIVDSPALCASALCPLPFASLREITRWTPPPTNVNSVSGPLRLQAPSRYNRAWVEQPGCRRRKAWALMGWPVHHTDALGPGDSLGRDGDPGGDLARSPGLAPLVREPHALVARDRAQPVRALGLAGGLGGAARWPRSRGSGPFPFGALGQLCNIPGHVRLLGQALTRACGGRGGWSRSSIGMTVVAWTSVPDR